MSAEGIVAHTGKTPEPHDVFGAWTVDVTSLVMLGAIGVLYWLAVHRSGSGPKARNSLRFWLGLGVTALAVASPLDLMADALASAHMVQHVLLVMIAGPLFATAEPVASILESVPRSIRKTTGRMRRQLGLTPARVTGLAPAMVWLVLAGSIWFWHAAGPYELALENSLAHLLEHAMFLGSSVLFWSVVLRPHPRFGPGTGFRVLMVFTMALQGVLLAALMTFAPSPWYPTYMISAPAWGLDALTDQQIAGLVMWIPAGLIYTGIGISLVVEWVSADSDREQRRHPSRTRPRRADS